MKKRMLSLLLAALCLAGMAACGQDAPAEPTSSEAATPETVEPEPPAPDPAELYVNNLPLEAQVAQMFFARCPAATLRARPRTASPPPSSPIRTRPRPPC